MRIRTIEDYGPGESRLAVTTDEKGFIYVSVSDTTHTGTVRIGAPGSGHEIPPTVYDAFRQLAASFNEFRDCATEHDACRRLRETR